MLQNRIVCIVGPVGSGKTERAARIFGGSDRAVVFMAVLDKAYIVRATHVIENSPMNDKALISLQSTMEQEAQFRIVFDNANDMIESSRNQITYPKFRGLLDICLEYQNLSLFLDEAHYLCSPWGAHLGLLPFTRVSRHAGINIMFISQRYGSLHRETTFNAHEFHFFRITEPRDLDGIANRCGEAVADRVQKLRRVDSKDDHIIPGECLVWTTEGEWWIE